MAPIISLNNIVIQILQINTGSMIIILLLIIVGLPLLLIILAIRALIKKKKKAAVWLLSCTIAYVLIFYIITWLTDGSTMARF